MKKAQLIKLLQEDSTPDHADMSLYLECTNDDKGVWGNVTDLKWDKQSKTLMLIGEYEESEY